MSITIDQILDIEGNTESVIVGLLTALGLPAYASDTNEVLPLPRVDVVATVVQSGPHEAALTDGERIFDQHQVNVNVSYVFAPDTPGMTTSAIKLFRSKTRRMVFFTKPLLQAFETQGIYFAAPNSIKEQGGMRMALTDEEAVKLEFSMELQLFINGNLLSTLSAY
jgi:hypothetical protein